MDSFTQALAWLLGVFNSAWDLAFSSIPATAITMLIVLIIISIVIDRLINPMIGKAIGYNLDRAMFSGIREKQKYDRANKHKEE